MYFRLYCRFDKELVNFFRYLPITHSPSFFNKPFPFEHIYNIFQIEGKGIRHQIGYFPLDEAAKDPYWLFWSLILYAGIAVTGFGIWRKRK